MKIKPLEKHNGRYKLAEVSEKLNEIIELLNKSFLTHDPDTNYGEVTNSLTYTSCDRLTPLLNETTCELTLFKNLFKQCEHEYRYFHCESIPRNSFIHSCQHKFSFICTKCEKVFTVTEDELRADYEAYLKEVNRRIAIGKPYDLEPSTLTLKTSEAGRIQFNGVACTLLMNKYKFLNLKEIEPPRYSHCEGSTSYAKGETI